MEDYTVSKPSSYQGGYGAVIDETTPPHSSAIPQELYPKLEPRLADPAAPQEPDLLERIIAERYPIAIALLAGIVTAKILQEPEAYVPILNGIGSILGGAGEIVKGVGEVTPL